MNPFDHFAGTLQAALPPQPSDGSVTGTVASGVQQQTQKQQQQLQAPQFNLMAQPQQEKKPVMNAPGMPGKQQQGGMPGMQPQGMYAQQPPQQQHGMYGHPAGLHGQQPQQPPPQQQQQNNQMMMMPSNSMMGGIGMQLPAISGNSMSGPPPPPPGGMNQMGGSMNGMMAPPMQQLTGAPDSGMAGALVQSNTQSNPYALGPPAASPQPGAMSANPFGTPATVAQLGANPQQQQMVQQNANPFGASAQLSAPLPAPAGSPLGAHQANNPMVAMDPFVASPPAAPIQQPPAPQLAAAPWGTSTAPVASQAMVPSAAPSGNDPFGIFGASPQAMPPSGGASVTPNVQTSAVGAPPSVYPSGATVAPSGAPPPPVPVQMDDLWAEMGFGSAPVPTSSPTITSTSASGPVPGEDDDLFNSGLQPTHDEDKDARGPKPAAEIPGSPDKAKSPKRKKGDLPPGGEWYDAKIFTPTLGVMFFKPKELVDSLFLQTEKKLVASLDERPVVAFIVEGSSARSAGVELGHVLLKVNGIDVTNPKEASRLIKEGPRPLPLLFYVPETQVVVAEGEHMVKYNTKETGAPNSAKDWKPKYLVIGGIIAQPWMMNMYRSKSEYDIAVIETQARRPVSVKVKQFSLQGARIQNDWQGPQMVKYKNKLHPWKYIVILPISRNPIKIASPNLSQLKPVHEGIRRVLQAQQRDRGGGRGQRATSSRGQDPYSSRAPAGTGGGYDTREQQGQRNGDHGGQASPGAYYGGRPTQRGY